MKQPLFLLFIITILLMIDNITGNAQVPVWRWANSSGSSAGDEGHSITADQNGFIYSTGFFRGFSINFGNQVLYNSGFEDIYIVKSDSAGNVIWAKSATGPAGEGGTHIAVDPENNVYVSGFFYGDSITLDAVTLYYNGMGDEDYFIYKLNENGNVLWAQSSSRPGEEHIGAMGADKYGNLIISGSFDGASFTIGNDVLINSHPISYNFFVAKFDSSGNPLWAKTAFEPLDDLVHDLATDTSANIYITGTFQDDIDFGSWNLVNTGGYDAFLIKYAPDGNVLWTKGTSGPGYEFGLGITTDDSLNVVLAGGYIGSAVLFDTLSLLYSPGYNSFIAKYDSAGVLKWAKSALNSGGNGIDHIITRGNEYIVSGWINDSLHFDSVNHYVNSIEDHYVAKIGLDGVMEWIMSVSGDSIEPIMDICAGQNRNIYITGYYNDPSLYFGNHLLFNNGDNDIFTACLGNTITGIVENNPGDLLIYPNPGNGHFSTATSIYGNCILEVYDLTGTLIYRKHLPGSNQGFDLPVAATGLLLIKLITGDSVQSASLVIVH